MGKHYEFIVIGGGSAGYAAARTFREDRDSVAIVDGSKDLGGLCILRGCMPSKTLLYAAEVLHHARHGERFGLAIPEASADMAAVHARKKRIIGEFAAYREEQLKSDRFDLFRSNARFLDASTIALDDGTELSADAFLVATGSVIKTPSLPGLRDAGASTSDDVLDLDCLPESVIVLGGGVVACELAQFLSRMGSKVSQIQRSPLILKEASAEASQVIMQVFKDEGIALFTGTRITAIESSVDSYTVRFEMDGESQEVSAALLFNALGREPATAALGLDMAGVHCRASGHIATDGYQRSNVPNIYAAGDCAGPHEIVHVAILQAEVAARHALGLEPAPVNFAHVTKIVFTDPQVATVGIPLHKLAADGVEVDSASYPFDDHGKSILMEATYGYVKVWARKSDGVLLGAECVGKDAGELIHSLAVGISLEATAPDLLKTHWYHPTLSEIWSYPLEAIAESV